MACGQESCQGSQKDIQTTQEIENFFNFVGKFIQPYFEKVLSEEEIAEMKRIQEIKERRYQAYLKRKESCWQAKYDAKRKPRWIRRKTR